MLFFLLLPLVLTAQPGILKQDVSFLPAAETGAADSYRAERAKLDIFVPEGARGAPVIVWFHGGGLTEGEKSVPEALRASGHVVVAAGYRLTPRARAADCLTDAAAAVAWVVRNIEAEGGDPKTVFLAGHSAGAYLALMLGLDRTWLRSRGVEADALAGLVALSPQTITHAAFRAEQGIPPLQPSVDANAPLYHVRGDAPPVWLVTGDREQELWGRYEENAYFLRMLALVGHRGASLIELPGLDHNQMLAPGLEYLIEEVDRVVATRRSRAEQ